MQRGSSCNEIGIENYVLYPEGRRRTSDLGRQTSATEFAWGRDPGRGIESNAGGPIFSRDRGLVFRSSTGTKVGYLFGWIEQRLETVTRNFASALVEFFDFFSYPAHTGDFD